MEDERSGSDVAAKEISVRVQPESSIEGPATAMTLDASSVHSGDRMVVDSDKPTDAVLSSASQTSLVSHSSNLLPSMAASPEALVPTVSLRSVPTGSASADMYGWEEGLEQKRTLGTQAGHGTHRRSKSLFPKVWGSYPPRPR